MLGRDTAFISGVLTKNRKVPEDVLDKMCDLMGKKREEVIAHEDSVFNTTLVTDNKAEPEKEEEEWKPFEERMMERLENDPERRHRFQMSNAYRSELEKGNDVLAGLGKKKDVYKEKWGKFIDCICSALKDGRDSVSVVELVQLIIDGV